MPKNRVQSCTAVYRNRSYTRLIQKELKHLRQFVHKCIRKNAYEGFRKGSYMTLTYLTRNRANAELHTFAGQGRLRLFGTPPHLTFVKA